HGWCSDQLKLYHVKKPADGPDYFDRLVSAVIDAVERGHIPRAQYGAVLIDEGHDFAPEWLRLIVQMVDPETNSLLLLYDDAQSIYSKRRTRKFSLKSVGIQAQGRTTILRVNYRNTNEILDCAFRVADGVIRPEDAGDDGIPVIKPEMAGRHGPRPKLIRARSIPDEAREIAEHLARFKSEGRPWRDMAVLYHANFVGDEIVAAFQRANIPFERLEKGDSRKYRVAEESVKLMTIYQSKGLEFPVVAVAGVGHMAHRPELEEEDARLLYVAMTRATEA